jgi:hypothetical protein
VNFKKFGKTCESQNKTKGVENLLFNYSNALYYSFNHSNDNSLRRSKSDLANAKKSFMNFLQKKTNQGKTSPLGCGWTLLLFDGLEFC